MYVLTKSVIIKGLFAGFVFKKIIKIISILVLIHLRNLLKLRKMTMRKWQIKCKIIFLLQIKYTVKYINYKKIYIKKWISLKSLEI